MLGRFARVLPESLPLKAEWHPDYALAPIDLEALSEANHVSAGGFAFTLEPWGSDALQDIILSFYFGPTTEKWPVWNLRVPQGISYQLWLWESGYNKRPRKLPTPRLR